jgi:hypothetical protein
MVKDDQGPSLPSLLKSERRFVWFESIAYQFVLGVMPTAVATDLTTLATSKARTHITLFMFVIFTAIKQLGQEYYVCQGKNGCKELVCGFNYGGKTADIHGGQGCLGRDAK